MTQSPYYDRRENDQTLGEVVRTLDALREESREALGKIDRRLESMETRFVPRESYELMVGGLKVEDARLAGALAEVRVEVRDATAAVAKLDEKIDDRYRSAVRLALTCFVGPLATGVFFFVLQQWVNAG